MICTVTFNPSLDYIVRVDDMRLGAINRTTYEQVLPGGKGVNVSIVLGNLGHASRALGFVAGFTGDELVRLCAEAGVDCDFIRVERGMTRVNVKVKSAEETELNGMGPQMGGGGRRGPSRQDGRPGRGRHARGLRVGARVPPS